MIINKRGIENKKWLTQGEAAVFCKVAPHTIQAWLKKKIIKAYHKPGIACRLYNADELQKIDQNDLIAKGRKGIKGNTPEINADMPDLSMNQELVRRLYDYNHSMITALDRITLATQSINQAHNSLNKLTGLLNDMIKAKRESTDKQNC